VSREERDDARDRWLRAQGYHVLRFWDFQVLQDVRCVLERIACALAQAEALAAQRESR